MKRFTMSYQAGQAFHRFTFIIIFVLATHFGHLNAAEVIVQNDSVATPGAGTPLTVFLQNERVASWMTAPVTGTIVGVQVLWDSQFGGNPASQELGIDIFSAGTFPTPGAPLATVVAPMLNDTVVNEFRHLDPPTNLVPLQVPVTAGQSFVVSLEFLNQSSGNPFASGVEIDNNGCQPNRNSAFAIPGGWIDACAAGVTGDFALRAIINPIPEPGSLLLIGAGLLLYASGQRAVGRV